MSRDIDNLFKSIFNNNIYTRKIFTNIKEINAIINGDIYFLLQRYNLPRLYLNPDQLVRHGYYNQYIDTLNHLLPNNDVIDCLNLKHNSSNNDKEIRYKRAIYISKFSKSFLNLLKLKKYDICISLALSDRFGKLFSEPLIEDFIIEVSRDYRLDIIKQIIAYYSNKHNNVKSIITQKVMDSILHQENNLNIIEYIHGIVESENILIKINYGLIANSGNIEVYRYFKNRKHTPSNKNSAIDVAANIGLLDVVEYLHFEGFGCSYRAMDSAAGSGHIHVLEFLQHNRTEGCSETALVLAAANGHIEVMEWLLQYRFDLDSITSKVLSAAAKNGHLDVIKIFQQYMTYDDEDDDDYGVLIEFPLSEAAAKGHLEIVRYCIEVGLTRNWCALQHAAEGNHMEVVKYLLEVAPSMNQTDSIGFEFKNISAVVTLGHIEMVKFIYSLPKYRQKLFYQPIDGYNEANATLMDGCFNSLELTRWFNDIYNNENHSKDNNTYVDPSFCFCTTELMDTASYYGQFDIVKFLHENRSEGCTSRAMNWAAERSNLELVKWFHDNRTEGCTVKAIDYCPSFEMVQFLLENRTEGFTSDAYTGAISNGNLDILLLLLDSSSSSSNLESKVRVDQLDFSNLLDYSKNVKSYPFIYQFLLSYTKNL